MRVITYCWNEAFLCLCLEILCLEIEIHHITSRKKNEHNGMWQNDYAQKLPQGPRLLLPHLFFLPLRERLPLRCVVWCRWSNSVLFFPSLVLCFRHLVLLPRFWVVSRSTALNCRDRLASIKGDKLYSSRIAICLADWLRTNHKHDEVWFPKQCTIFHRNIHT